MMRVGLIGLGIHGMRYAKHITADVDEMQLTAVARRDAAAAERVASEFGVEWHDDPSALIRRDDVDAVIIVTPPPSHLPLATLALECSKPVLLEKPLTQTLMEARQLQRVASRTGGRLFLAQTLRYSESLSWARRELHRIGPVRSLTASQRLPHTDLEWQNRDTEDPLGSILNTGVHLYDLVRWMLGAEFDTVYTVARRHENAFQEDFFKTQATLRDRDTVVSLEIAKCTQSRSSSLELVGERGQIWVDYQTDQVTLVDGASRTRLREGRAVYTIPRLLRDFARHTIGSARMPIGVVDGVRTLEVVDASYRSVVSRRPERVAIE